MFPVLFRIGNIPVSTYYVIWCAALALALRWCVARMALYGIDEDEGRRVIFWGFLGMIAGARAIDYVMDFPAYWNDPSLLLDLNKGGLSERGAISGGLIAVLILCRRWGKMRFFKLCETIVLPGFLTIAIGRWGCFFAGCCVGVESTFPLALHFPYDAQHVSRHAAQLYYSFSAALILLSLFFLERRLARSGKLPPYPILTPLGLIFYSIMRLAIDSLRLGHNGFQPSDAAMAAALLAGIASFIISWNASRKKAAPLQRRVSAPGAEPED